MPMNGSPDSEEVIAKMKGFQITFLILFGCALSTQAIRQLATDRHPECIIEPRKRYECLCGLAAIAGDPAAEHRLSVGESQL